MSVDRSSLAGFGLLIDMDKTFPARPKGEKPSCEHPEREGQTYCPKCGKKVEMIKVDKYDAAYDFDFTEIVEEMDFLPDGYIGRRTDYYSGNKYFIGWGSHSYENDKFIAPHEIPNIEEVREVVKGILLAIRDIKIEQAGGDGKRMESHYPDVYSLNERRFGFHVITCYS